MMEGRPKDWHEALNHAIDRGDDIDLEHLDHIFENGEISQEEHRVLYRKISQRNQHIKEGLVHAANKLEEISNIDFLTGVLNRQGLEKELEAARKRLNSEKDPEDSETRRKSNIDYILFFYIDTDNFKYINDTYGHTKGDEALKLIAKYLEEEAIERGGKAARFGGDEFVIMQESQGNVTLPDVQKFSKRIQKKINSFLSLSIDGKENEKFNFSISVGGAILRKGEEKTSEELKHEADEQMYLVKRKGKNGNGNGNRRGTKT